MITRVRRLRVLVQWLIIISVGLLELFSFFFFFYRFLPIKLIGSLLESAAGLIEFVGKLFCRRRPQYAQFLTCFCKTSAPGKFGLKLFCYPQELLYDVEQQVRRCEVHYIGQGSSDKPVCEEEISVYFSKEILFTKDEDPKTTIKVVRYNIINLFLAHQVHRILTEYF